MGAEYYPGADRGTLAPLLVGGCAVFLGILRETTAIRPARFLSDLAAAHPSVHPGVLLFCCGVAIIAWSLAASRRLARLRVLPRAKPLQLTSSTHERGLEQAALFSPAAAERFARTLAAALAPPAPAAVLVVDIEGFSTLRWTCGGDEANGLAGKVGQLLIGLTPPGASVAWLAADEFAMLLPNCGDAAARAAAAHMLTSLCRPVSLDGRDVDVAASIGVAMAPAHGATAESLLSAARLAVALAKADGGRDWRMFDSAQCQAAQDRTTLRAELRPALEAGQFVPYYQPIVSLLTGEIVGMEVLARWHHPQRGLLAPDMFIHMMEEHRLCAALSLCLLRQVVADAASWPQAWTFAFNASACQLRELQAFITDALLRSDGAMAPHRIELEVTETALIEDMGLARMAVQSMHRSGVKVVLDDFGTGYANFLHLRELPFDRIKIDRSFVADMQLSARTDACLKAMLSLARSLGASVIAEGVENEAAESKLRSMGCDFGQGFYYAPPVPAEGVPLLIRRAESRATSRLAAA